MTSLFSLLLEGCLCSLWLGAWDPSQIRGRGYVRRGEHSSPGPHPATPGLYPGMLGAVLGLAPWQEHPRAKTQGTREVFPCFGDAVLQVLHRLGLEERDGSSHRGSCPCRGDSHRPRMEEPAGKHSFPQLSLRKSIFCRKGCVPRAHAATAETSCRGRNVVFICFW